MSDKNLDSIEDEDELHKMLNATEDFEERKKIRARLRELGKQQSDTKDVLKEADDKKSEEEAVFRSTKTETGEDGSKLTTTTTTTKQSTKEGDTTVTKQTKTVTQSSGLGGTSYKVTKTSAGTKTTGARGARDAFKQLDKANPSEGSGKKVTIDRSPSSIKQMLLDWCARQVRDYEGVKITNFSSSWNDVMAFCALIHRFYPRCFDFKKLNPKARKANFKLGFTVAEKEGGIAPLLEVEDMVRMKNPDWKCVFTYVQMFYRKFRDWDDSLTLEENQAAVKDKF